MKKLIWMSTAVLLVVPSFAQEASAPVKVEGRAPLMQPQEGRHEAFQKAHKEQMEKMKATQEKAEKLVKEYNKLKDGKKKDAKKAEITELVASVREEQLKFNEKQLGQFEDRLGNMKKGLAAERSAEAKKTWVDQKTEQLIAKEGDMKVLFDRVGKGPHMDGQRGPGMEGKDPRAFGKEGKCPCMKEKGEGKGECAKDGKKYPHKHFGKGGPRVGINPPPPPPLEEK